MPDIDVYLYFMLEQRASDTHLSSNMPVAYRIDGEMVFTESEPLTSEEIEAMAFEIMPQRLTLRLCLCIMKLIHIGKMYA